MNSLNRAISSSGSDLDEKLVRKTDKQLGNPSGSYESNELDMEGRVSDELVDNLLNPPIQVMEVDTFKRIYPKKVNQETAERCVELINESVQGMDFMMRDHYRDTLISVFDVLDGSNGKYKFTDYLNAVKFVTYKLAGHSDVRAYAMTFPDRVNRMAKEKIPNSHLYAYANGYAKNKLVVDIHSKLIVPTHILFQDVFHQAVKVQASIMNDDSVSPKVRSDAANSLMTHLKQPEVKKAELEISTKDTGVIGELANALNNLGSNTVELMKSGKYTMKDLREATIIEVEKDNE